MRKISLDIDTLQVDSFATVEDGAPREGTVHAHYASFPDWCTDTNTQSRTWNGWGCESISGEVACLCDPSWDARRCDTVADCQTLDCP